MAANAIPAPLVKLWREWEEGRAEEARRSFYSLLPFFKARFLETNPIPLKYLMGLSGAMSGLTRSPMFPPSEPVKKELDKLAAQWAPFFPPSRLAQKG